MSDIQKGAFMKTRVIVCVLFPLYAVSFSQTAYDKCVQECMKAGGSLATCSNEDCNPADTQTTIVTGTGNPLFLPSYQLKGTAPDIDGSLLSSDGNPSTSESMDEWKEACSRTLILSDSTHTQIQLFLENSPDTLYIGMTYQDADNSNGCGVRLLFDQGNNVPPSLYHGSTDMNLTAPNGICNEKGCSINKAGGSVVLHEQCWNGSAWRNNGDGQINFRGASYFFNSGNKIHHYEFAIPLHSPKANDSANSYLNVHPDDAIGFYIEVTKMAAEAGVYNWIETNGRPNRIDTFPLWAKIQLSVPRDFFTFYTGRGTNPAPTIDGSIQEPVWNSAYQRELLLSNFHYNAIRSRIWCLEDSAQNNLYIGARIYGKTQNAQNYCQIYFEEDGTDPTSMTRNYLLDNNAEKSVMITSGGVFSDRYWNTGSGSWDTVLAASGAQSAGASRGTDYTDYEFKVARSAGAYNLNVPKGSLLGFLVRFHDADKTDSTRTDFYWEYTTNNDAQLLDYQSHPYVYISTGWTNLQLGGPSVQVVKPVSGDSIYGIVPVEIRSGQDSLKSAECFLSSDTTHRVALVYQGNGIWTGSIDASGLPAGQEVMLIVRVVTAAGITYERIVNKVNEISVLPLSPGQTRHPFGAQVYTQSKQRPLVFVNLEKPGTFELVIYAINGKKIWSDRVINAVAGSYRISVAPYSPCMKNGTYLLMLNQGGTRGAYKFSVVK
jgi:hypothetical protein